MSPVNHRSYAVSEHRLAPVFHPQLPDLAVSGQVHDREMHILRIVHMLIGIKVMHSHHNIFPALTALFRDGDLSRAVFHVQFRREFILSYDLLRNPDRIHFLHIQKSPHRIGCCQPLAFRRFHHEIPQSHESLELIWLRAGPHRFPHDGASVEVDLPVIDHPRDPALSHVIESDPQVLRLKRCAVLKVVDRLFRRQFPSSVDFAVSDPSVKCIHYPFPVSSIFWPCISRSERPRS